MERGMSQYIAFDANKYTEEQRKAGGHPDHAVLGIILGSNEFHAQDNASTLFQDKTVFVRDLRTASKEFVAAAEKMGILNSSDAHRI